MPIRIKRNYQGIINRRKRRVYKSLLKQLKLIITGYKENKGTLKHFEYYFGP